MDHEISRPMPAPPRWRPAEGDGWEAEPVRAGRARRAARRISAGARVWVPALMFAATLYTTLMAGALQRGVFPSAAWAHPALLWHGLPFAATLLLILGAHELGHYIASRRWGVDASLPYFIPAPTLFGTFGAVIRIRGRIRNRRSLLDVAVAGPLGGMAVALPATFIGLALSRVVPGAGDGAAVGLELGSSWLFEAATWAVLGPLGPADNVVLHPVAFAGWCGFLVTSLNLIPAGQLDGGHIVYTLFGRWHRVISYAVGLGLLAMALWWQGWLIWAAIVLVMGRRHPPLLDESESLGRGRRLVGAACLVIMVLTFTRIPIQVF